MDGIIQFPADQFRPGAEGAFNLPPELYHDYQAAPGISRSLVVEMLKFTEAHAYSVIEGRFSKKETGAMQSGSVFDTMLLEPDRFGAGMSHWVVPAGMNLTTVDGRAWKKDHPKDGPNGLPYIWAESDAPDKASLVDMEGMMVSLLKHRMIRRLIETSIKQESAFALDPRTGLMRKVRPDMRASDNSSRLILVDLKSTFRGGINEHEWVQHCGRMYYDIQDSMTRTYRDLWEEPFFLFAAVERKPPYAARLFQLDVDSKKFARAQYQRTLDRFRRCQDSGVWPSYDEGITIIGVPGWRRRIEEPDEVDL